MSASERPIAAVRSVPLRVERQSVRRGLPYTLPGGVARRGRAARGNTDPIGEIMGTRSVRDTVGVAAATVVVGVGLIVLLAAFGVDSGQQAMHPRHAAPAQDLNMQPSDLHNLHAMTMVRGFFVDNRLGHLTAALRVARAGRGVYPVGTIVQLVPQEAMVKRRKGFNPATRDWEFFFLRTTP